MVFCSVRPVFLRHLQRTRRPLGTFDTQSGVQRVLLRAPDDVAFSVAAITEEPAGGSPRPTPTPFLVGNIGE
jgi:hypothetical protein